MSINPNKVVIITGSSRGIGAATAKLAGDNGYSVCVNYIHNESAARSIVNSIKATGAKACLVQADVSNEQDVKRLFDTTEKELGMITDLVNNVGILDTQTTLANMEADRIERILKTNIMSAFLCSKEAINRMALSKGGEGGQIVNVSSAASRRGSAGEYIDYAASKGAIDSLTIGLSNEVAGDGIRVNCARPGLIYTDIHALGGEKNRVDRLGKTIPLKRGGTPLEVAQAIIWLLSEKSSYVTGAFIDITGGL